MKASGVLKSWDYKYDPSTLLDEDCDGLEEMKFADAGEYLDIEGEFGDSCSVIVNKKEFQNGGKTKITRCSSYVPEHVNICLLKPAPSVKINIGGWRGKIFIGKFGDTFIADIELWRASRVFIGSKATCGGARFFLSEATVIVGYDSMISDEVLLQATDQHGIVDLTKMEVVNYNHRETRIGKHVWIGRRSILTPGCSIGDGAIVGTGAIVTGDIEKSSICAGVPARVVKRNMSWLRTIKMTPEDEAIFQSFSEW